MKGQAIPGPHFVQVDLEAACAVDRVVVDFETAYAKDYEVLGLSPGGDWVRLAAGAAAAETRPAKQHVVHTLAVSTDVPVAQVKVDIRRPATQWGVSIWELAVYGTC